MHRESVNMRYLGRVTEVMVDCDRLQTVIKTILAEVFAILI